MQPVMNVFRLTYLVRGHFMILFYDRGHYTELRGHHRIASLLQGNYQWFY